MSMDVDGRIDGWTWLLGRPRYLLRQNPYSSWEFMAR